jgi:hypothetical protein
VFLPRRNVPRAEENREQRNQCAEAQGHAMLHRLAGEDADGVGHRLNLQRQQRQHADQHEDRGQCAGPGAAEAEGEQIGQRRQLIRAGDFQDRIQKHRRQQKRAGDAQIAGQKSVAVLIGQAHRAVKRPRTGIHAQRQGVRQRVANDRPGDHAPFADPGYAEQHRQVGGADQDHLGQAKAHRHLFGSAG